MDFGTRIQKLLDEKEITQKELAQHLHLSPNTINGYIRNTRTPDAHTVAQIAAYLNTTSDYLLGVSEPPLSHISRKEHALINSYRSLDSKGKKLLDDIVSNMH